MKIILLLLCHVWFFSVVGQVTVQSGSGVYLQNDASVFLQNDLYLLDAINGEGTLHFVGTTAQSVNAGGHSLPAMTIDNEAGVKLIGNLNINQSLTLTQGILHCINNTLGLQGTTPVQSGSPTAYISTEGTGAIRLAVTTDLQATRLAIGSSKEYAPVEISCRGPYRAASLTIAAANFPLPGMEGHATTLVPVYWTTNRSGIAGSLLVRASLPAKNSSLEMIGGYLSSGNWLTKQVSLDPVRQDLIARLPEGISQLSAMQRSAVSLFPNPARNVTELRWNAVKGSTGAVIIIRDAAGKELRREPNVSGEGPARASLNLTALPVGQYAVELIENDRRYTQLLIIAR